MSDAKRVEDAHLQRGDVERLRSEVTMSAVKSAAVHLGGMRDGRKALILVSEGPARHPARRATLMTDLVRTANDNNTAIYVVDPRGLAAALSVALGGSCRGHRRQLLPQERSGTGLQKS